MAIQVVVGARRKNLKITVKNVDDTLPNVTGWTARLTGKSKVNGLSFDVAGAIDGAAANATFKWTEIGWTNYVTSAQLAGIRKALFTCQLKVTDAGGLPDWGPEFEMEWLLPVLG